MIIKMKRTTRTYRYIKEQRCVPHATCNVQHHLPLPANNFDLDCRFRVPLYWAPNWNLMLLILGLSQHANNVISASESKLSDWLSEQRTLDPKHPKSLQPRQVAPLLFGRTESSRSHDWLRYNDRNDSKCSLWRLTITWKAEQLISVLMFKH